MALRSSVLPVSYNVSTWERVLYLTRDKSTRYSSPFKWYVRNKRRPERGSTASRTQSTSRYKYAARARAQLPNTWPPLYVLHVKIDHCLAADTPTEQIKHHIRRYIDSKIACLFAELRHRNMCQNKCSVRWICCLFLILFFWSTIKPNELIILRT